MEHGIRQLIEGPLAEFDRAGASCDWPRDPEGGIHITVVKGRKQVEFLIEERTFRSPSLLTYIAPEYVRHATYAFAKAGV